jgi:hypothetical protein
MEYSHMTKKRRNQLDSELEKDVLQESMVPCMHCHVPMGEQRARHEKMCKCNPSRGQFPHEIARARLLALASSNEIVQHTRRTLDQCYNEPMSQGMPMPNELRNQHPHIAHSSSRTSGLQAENAAEPGSYQFDVINDQNSSDAVDFDQCSEICEDDDNDVEFDLNFNEFNDGVDRNVHSPEVDNSDLYKKLFESLPPLAEAVPMGNCIDVSSMRVNPYNSRYLTFHLVLHIFGATLS